MNIEQKPWFEFMDNVLKGLLQHEVCSMAVVARVGTGETLTAYFDADPEDKAVMCHHVQTDILMDTLAANADLIKEMLEHGDGEE